MNSLSDTSQQAEAGCDDARDLSAVANGAFSECMEAGREARSSEWMRKRKMRQCQRIPLSEIDVKESHNVSEQNN